MILHKLPYLSSKRINLSSKSPRRNQLLNDIGLHFENHTTDVEEDGDHSHPDRYVMQNAVKKLYPSDEFDLNIASDTVVVHKNEILEKPRSKEMASDYLKRLSDNTHDVFTGVALKFKTETVQFFEKTSVQFYTLEEQFISAYIETGDPMDKAGAYGIQGIGASFIKSLNGCYYNVMGFPVAHFCIHINKAISKGLL